MKKKITKTFTVKDAALLEWALKDVEPLPGRSFQGSAEILRNDKNNVRHHSKKPHPLDSNLKTREKKEIITLEKALSHGTSTGLDRRSAQRMRRGKLQIEARLDLHGYNQEEAYRELKDFIFRTHSQQKRLVLIITGKGNKGFGSDTKKRLGVLREVVPKWLNEQTIRDRIISFDYATQKDGGYGALYVLLKKTKF